MSASFSMWPAPRDLAPAVQMVWRAQGSTLHRREAVLPNGVVELIINLSDPQWVVGDGFRSRRRFEGTFVAGLQVRPLLIEEERSTDLLGIRFAPGGLSQWVRLPLAQLTDQVFSVEELGLGWLGEGLRSRLLEEPDEQRRLGIVFEVLREQRRGVSVDRRVRAAVAALRQNEHLTLGRLAATLGVTHQHLDVLFRHSVGVPPRLLLRVLRFHQTVSALRDAPSGTRLASIASDAGYADQAHFNRTFRELAGCTPSHYLARRTSDGWHLIVE